MSGPRALLALCAALVALAALAFVLVTGAQRRFVFPGSSATIEAGPETLGGERIWLDLAGGRSEAWLLPGAVGGPLLVYAHGNGELIDHWLDEFAPARALGASALLVEYPGYGRSTGSPSERTVSEAMRAAYDFAVRERGHTPERIVGWGRSLGGGAVCALARERPLAALVLESTFTSVVSMAERMGLPRVLAPVLVRDPFDNLGLLRAFRGPVLVLHGTRDEIVPPAEAEALGAVPGVELRWLPCGHNDCARPWPLVLRFLAAHGLLPSAAETHP